ncbi:unnamed protein product [Linum tenue]|uniref:Uncharacterized protein n=1 Tax=Linum tenue TaxID=586396 RepID=A0AAV0PE68_9ROSI|nr:unnamed protein product [Linum tenue]
MASSPNYHAAALFLLLALFSTAAHGRESHFFSKVAADTNPTPTTVTISPDSKATLAAASTNNGQQYQQQPSFVQENDNNGYGIYGHQTPEETTSFDQTAASTKLTSSPTNSYNAQTNSDETFRDDVNPNAFNNGQEGTASFDQTATTTRLTSTPTNSYLPYNAQTNSDETFRNENNDEKYYNNDRYYGQSGYNGDNNNNDDEFEDEDFGETTSLQQQDNTGYKTTVAKGYNYNNNNGAERQGMSDTRFMEGGKYYVDINNPNQYQQGMSSSSSSDDFSYGNNNVKNQNGYFSNGNNGDEYANPMNNRNQQQQQQEAEYFQGNNYQNQQYVP